MSEHLYPLQLDPMDLTDCFGPIGAHTKSADSSPDVAAGATVEAIGLEAGEGHEEAA